MPDFWRMPIIVTITSHPSTTKAPFSPVVLSASVKNSCASSWNLITRSTIGASRSKRRYKSSVDSHNRFNGFISFILISSPSLSVSLLVIPDNHPISAEQRDDRPHAPGAEVKHGAPDLFAQKIGIAS